MGAYVASEVVKLMLKSGKPVKDNKALMLGITFKENCPDIINTRAIDIYHELNHMVCKWMFLIPGPTQQKLNMNMG